MLRKLLDGPLLCEPIEDAAGRRGYRVTGTGTYGRLLGSRVVNDGGGPDGFSPLGAAYVVEGDAAA
jgi:hypothetical protein